MICQLCHESTNITINTCHTGRPYCLSCLTKEQMRDPYSQVVQILCDLHWHDGYFDLLAAEDAKKLYPYLEGYPVLQDLFDAFIFPKLAERLAFGEPRKGDLFAPDDA